MNITYAEADGADFFVPDGCVQDALAAVLQLNAGTPGEPANLAEALKSAGFDTSVSQAGTAITHYDGHGGHEGDYLAALAPLAREGSFVNFIGATGDRWRLLVRDGRLISQHPRVDWVDDSSQPAQFQRAR